VRPTSSQTTLVPSQSSPRAAMPSPACRSPRHHAADRRGLSAIGAFDEPAQPRRRWPSPDSSLARTRRSSTTLRLRTSYPLPSTTQTWVRLRWTSIPTIMRARLLPETR
jgi:hypothetical protein